MKPLGLLLIFVFGIVLNAKPVIVVSILPQQVFVDKIAKEKVDVMLMVKPGNSPHSYEPKPSQMLALSKAQIYFSIGVGMENIWLDRFKAQNKDLQFIDVSKGVSKIAIGEHHKHHNAKNTEATHEDKERLDPHIWTSPENVKIIAKNIFNTLVKIDESNKIYYKANFDAFMKEIENTDNQIKTILKDTPQKSKFMVFHPSWGYFADAYNLEQIAVEIEGKSPKAREMVMIIQEAKEENVKVIFTQPEFSDKSATIIAKKLGIQVKKISPLNPQWSQNLINMATTIAEKK